MRKTERVKKQLKLYSNIHIDEDLDEALDIIQNNKQSLRKLYKQSYYSMFSVFLYRYFKDNAYNIDKGIFYKHLRYSFGIFSPLSLYAFGIILLSIPILVFYLLSIQLGLVLSNALFIAHLIMGAIIYPSIGNESYSTSY